MKKLLFVLVVCAPWVGWGQESADQPLSEAEKISAKAGALVETQFVEIGKVKGVTVEMMNIQNLTDKSTVRALRLSYTKVSQYSSDEKISVLDKDEIEGLILSLQQIQTLSTETRDNYTEVTFKSRTGFKAGAYYTIKEKSWQGYLDIGRLAPANVYLSMGDMEKVLRLVENVRSRM